MRVLLLLGSQLSVFKLLKLACLCELFQLRDGRTNVTDKYSIRKIIHPTMALDLLTLLLRGAASPTSSICGRLRRTWTSSGLTDKSWGGWWDLNPRHPEPQSGATTN
jgi:hypothetical protein